MLKKCLKTACMMFMGAILLFNVLTMTLSGLDLRDRLNWLPGALLTVDSGSMEPLLSEGDLLFVWETPFDQLEVGDIVTFHGNNELITHQIIREDGEYLVTRGAANNTEDAPIGPEEYCARVAWVLPGAGTLLDILADPVKLALVVVAVAALFYGPTLVIWLTGLLAGEEKRRFQMRPLRFMSLITTISLLCSTPFMTAAKYTANINEFGSVTAGATYLTSNYLSEEGNIYYIEGWRGQGYGISLYVRNYENDLLFNKTGYNLKYELEFNILSADSDRGETYKTCYDISLWDGAADNAYTPTNGIYGPFTIEGDDTTRQEEHFEVQVETDENVTLASGDMIRFQIIVSTTSDTDFDRSLIGDFTFVVADAESFLSEHGPVSQPGSALVTYSLKTELVQGATTRNVKVTWDSKKMYLNEYESTAANVILTDRSKYSPDDGTGHGFLIMSLHAYSNVNLQFFKYNSADTILPSDFTCTEVEAGT